jgi:hypothetical protein
MVCAVIARRWSAPAPTTAPAPAATEDADGGGTPEDAGGGGTSARVIDGHDAGRPRTAERAASRL